MIFKQPNGLYGRVSSVVDAPTHVNMTLKDVRDWLEETGQLHPEVSVEGWLNMYEGSVEDAVDRVFDNNMTIEEIEKWKKEIGYEEKEKMTDIPQEVWDMVVRYSPYVHISYELYYDEGNVDLYADAERTEVVETVWQPNMYVKALGTWKRNPYRYTMLYSAIDAVENNIGELSYSQRDLDHDYWHLDDVGYSVDSMEELVDFLNTHIPEIVFKENDIKLVDEEKNLKGW